MTEPTLPARAYQADAPGARPAPGSCYHLAVAIDLDATVPAAAAATGASGASPPAPPGPLDRTATAAGSARALAAVGPGREVGAGTRLAHFRLERLLGQGGMGQVWLATDLALDRPVAIKLLPAATAGDPDRRARLVREARSQARLVHPNVCHIYFIGEEDGLLFFAMEYVRGETLARRLERGPLPPDEALELTRMAAAGLRAADAAGFTHRDIKPSNLMIDHHGVLKVMDFGLVASSPTPEPGAAGGGAAPDDAPVAASALVGTPLYMAPEQGRGEAVDRRADIYALGATLHHMIAGAPPFAGDTAADLLGQHQSALRPRLTATAPLPRAATLADEVVARMMAKRAADRPADYDEVLALLTRASTVHTRPAGMWVRAAAAAIDLLVTALVVLPLTLVTPFLDDDVLMTAVWLVGWPLALARWGATPGRALFELAVVPDRGRGRVRFLQAVLRYLAEYGPLTLGGAVADLGTALDHALLRTAGIALAVAGVAYVAIEVARAALRSVDKRPLWDRLAGTRTCYRPRAAAGSP